VSPSAATRDVHETFQNETETRPRRDVDTSRDRDVRDRDHIPGSNLSASGYVRRVISDSAKSLYALRVLCYHGMNDTSLQTVFRTIVVSRLTYASPAWGGFITALDLRRVDAFLRRCKRSGYCQSDLPDFDELLGKSDDRLFLKTPFTHCTHSHHHSPQHRSIITSDNKHTTGNCQYTVDTYILDKNFIIRLLYKDIY
jgi:hypothetical protein